MKGIKVKKLLILKGLFLCAVSNLVFASLAYVDDNGLFIAISVIGKVIQGKKQIIT